MTEPRTRVAGPEPGVDLGDQSGVTPSVAAAPAGQAGLVLALQRQVGNAAVSRMIAARRVLARFDPPVATALSPEEEAQKLIDDHQTLGLLLDEEGLAKALADLLPQKEAVAKAVFTKLASHNKDDVALELAKACAGKLKDLSKWLKLEMVLHLAYGVVADDEEEQIAALWKSFGPPAIGTGPPEELAAVADQHADLWRKSLKESDELVAYIAPVVSDFKRDVIDVAQGYLKTNRKIVTQEAERYGIDLTGKGRDRVAQSGYLDDMMGVARNVARSSSSGTRSATW